MKRYAFLVIAIGVFGLAILSIALGMNLLPTREVAGERGTLAAWVLTWIVIWITVFTTFVLAGYVFVAGVMGPRNAHP
jgi:hypothetical protein